MTFYYALLLVIAVALVLLGIMAILARVDRKQSAKQFDERQQAARGKAYEWAFWVGFAYFAMIAILDGLLPDGLQASIFLVAMVGLSLEGFVVGCYCIFHDAYLPLTQSPKANIIILYILGAVQLLNAVIRVKWMTVTLGESGIQKTPFAEVMLSANEESAIVWLHLIVTVMSFVLATLELIHYIRDKRSEP